MPADVLERVLADINDRLETLAGAVGESQRLESALTALQTLPMTDGAARSTLASSEAAVRAGRSNGKRTRRGRRRRSAPGSKDSVVFEALEGQKAPLDIKTVAQRTGLSQQSASYVLKKLAGSGVVSQSSQAGGPGAPKLLFSLTGAAHQAPSGESANGAAAAEARRPPARKAKRKARANARGGVRPGAARDGKDAAKAA